VRNWKRKNGQIQKKNDHLCDSSVCYFSKFIERLGTTNLRIVPQSFTSQVGIPAVVQQGPVVVRDNGGMRVPIMRSFGSR
jgi:hypothetical protein